MGIRYNAFFDALVLMLFSKFVIKIFFNLETSVKIRYHKGARTKMHKCLVGQTMSHIKTQI